jgi:hypothetical protein
LISFSAELFTEKSFAPNKDTNHTTKMKEAHTPKPRQGFSHRIPSMLAVVAIVAGGASQAHATAVDQIAIRLGATQLGFPSSYTPGTNNLWDASALRQGQLALAATTANVNTTAFVVSPVSAGYTNPTVVPNPQSTNFRTQYLAAVQSALTSPTLATIPKTTVKTFNPRTKTYVNVANVTGTLSPASTTPTLILNSVVAKMPNFAPAIVSNAVAATMAGTTGTNGIFIPVWGAVPRPTAANLSSSNNINLFNSRTASTQLSNAGKAASAALTAASKAYTRGTVNWQGWPATGATNPNGYLPNFGVTTLGPRGGTGSQIQAPNLTGLADTASAVAANAINGLGNFNTNSATAPYGKSATNVQFMTQQLIKAASAFQKSSTRVITGSPAYPTGSLGAASFGITTQVAGDQNVSWGSQASPDGFTLLLNGVVRGAVAAVGKTSPNLGAIAAGVAQGFTVTYLQTTYNGNRSFVSLNQFLQENVNNNAIALAFAAAGVTGNSYNTVITSISSGVNNAWNAFNQDTGTWTLGGNINIAGAKGINLGNTNSGITPLINGVGTPVTDTTGL